MSTENQTYEQRVRAIAEEMAQATCKKMAAIDGSGLTWEDAGKEEQELFIETHVPAAQIAVKHMADICGKSFKEGWSSARPSGDMWEEADQLSNSLGLIPDNAQEGGQDANV